MAVLSHSAGNKKGLTLLEVTLALMLGSLVILSLTYVFRLSRANWERHNHRGQLVQHARIAMDRIIGELRYTSLLVDAAVDNLQFETTELIDTNPDVEEIRYWHTPGDHFVQRTVDNAPAGGLPVAGFYSGDPLDDVIVANFEAIPMKLDAGNNLIPLDIIGGDTMNMAVAVRVDLSLSDGLDDTITVSSIAQMRNL